MVKDWPAVGRIVLASVLLVKKRCVAGPAVREMSASGFCIGQVALIEASSYSGFSA